MRQLEEKIQSLTKNLNDLQFSLVTMNEHVQKINSGGSRGRNPADAAQPEIEETIHSIQTKLDQLDNRTQVTQTHSSRVCVYRCVCDFVKLVCRVYIPKLLLSHSCINSFALIISCLMKVTE